MRQSAMSRCVAVLVTAAFAWTIALSASPGLHERIHPGENRADHSCAVTVLRSGSFLHSSVPSLNLGGDFVAEFATIVELSPYWVPSQFLIASVFEHAPQADA